MKKEFMRVIEETLLPLNTPIKLSMHRSANFAGGIVKKRKIVYIGPIGSGP